MIEDQFRVIQELIDNDQYESAVQVLFQVVRLPEFNKKAYEMTSLCLRMLGEHQLAEMFDQCLIHDSDPVLFFMLGVTLSRKGLFGAALGPLHQSSILSEKSPEVCLELGVALLKEGYFEDAKRFLEWSVSLKKPEIPYFLGILAVFRKDLTAAEFYLKDLTLLSKETAEGISLLQQLQETILRFNERDPIDLRDWHYVQHGKVLLRLNKDEHLPDERSTGRYTLETYTYNQIGEVLHALLLLLENLTIWHDYRYITYVGENVKPIALALSKVKNIVLLAPENIELNTPGIVITENNEEFLKILEYISDRNDLLLFSLYFDWSKDSPILPDIIGCMANFAWMPWEEQYKLVKNEVDTIEPDPRDAESIAEDILGSIKLTDPNFSQQLLQYYQYREDQLRVGKQTESPRRPFFCESPIQK